MQRVLMKNSYSNQCVKIQKEEHNEKNNSINACYFYSSFTHG